MCFYALPCSLIPLCAFWVLLPWAQLCNVLCWACCSRVWCSLSYVVPCSVGPVSIELRWALRVIHCKEETLSHSGTMTVAMLMWPLLTATFCMPFPLMFILSCAKSHFIPWGDVLFSESCTAVKQLKHRVSHIYMGNSWHIIKYYQVNNI